MSEQAISERALAEQALAEELAALRRWLIEAALPLWAEHGVDRAHGGFFEALDLQTHTCAAPFRRLRVVARQVVVFSQAHLVAPDGPHARGYAEAMQLGLDFLARHAALDDGGYAWRFDLAHRPIDLTRDLYDHAFVLLALSSASAVVGGDALRGTARALMDWLDDAFTHPLGGYQESLPPALPRRQNPHMHLLEAVLAAYAAFRDPVYLGRAEALVALFDERLFDHASGALPEYFDDALRPLRNGGTLHSLTDYHTLRPLGDDHALHPIRQDGLFTVEPGHHCEWVWLLHQAQGLGVRRPGLEVLSDRLMGFVDRHGIDPVHGGLIDAVASSGAAQSHGARLWPQTERLRAEFVRPDRTVQRQLQAVRALRAHLRPDGLWHERRSESGVLSADPAPASSLYHLTGAILSVT